TSRTRKPSDVARRAILLHAMVHISIGADRVKVMEWLHDTGLIGATSPLEAELLTRFRVPYERRVEASWDAEHLATLLWAMKRIDMPPPDEKCDVRLFGEILPPDVSSRI